MKTTFSRTFVTLAVILMAAAVLVGVSFQLLVRNYFTRKTVDGLKADSYAIAQVAEAYFRDDTLSGRDFLIILSVVAEISDADTVICDREGQLQLCSHAPLGCEHQGMTISDRSVLRRIFSEEHVVSSGIIQGLYEEERYAVSTAIRDARTGEELGFVIVSTPMDETMGVLQQLTDSYTSVSILVVLIAVVATTVYVRKSSGPLRDMARTAGAFGHGNLQARAQMPQGAPEEIRELALAFNNMAQSLEQSENQRKEFVANVSHELKTPMTTIGGYVDGMLDGTIPPAQQPKYLGIVSDEIKRLSRLVRSMLDISRLQEQDTIPEEKKTVFDMSECAGQVLITFEQKILDKGLEVEVDMPDFPVMTYACRDYITQVVYNLVDNAVKFCPQGGTLRLRVKPGAKKIYVSVANDGDPIPPEQLPLVFDRFHKLDKSRSLNRDGWGLGLYIVKTLVCSHGEDISVTSSEGKTEFTFTLPVAN